MRNFKFGMPSPALIISIVSLFVALGSVSYAATQLAKNSVGTKQIKKNAVNSSKVKDKSLLATDFKPGQIPSGAQGIQGVAGQNGAPGISGWQRVVTTIPTSSTDAIFAEATCPGDKKVLGGGVRLVSGEGVVVIDEAHPISDTKFYGESRTTSGSPVNHGMVVTAICANVSP